MNIQVLGRDSRGWFYHTGATYDRNVRITKGEYDSIVAEVRRLGVPHREESWHGQFNLHFATPFVYHTPQVAPCGTNSHRVVHVQHLDGTTETDAEWWARQGELADLAATTDAASYRSQ